jgi:hypothetical protein
MTPAMIEATWVMVSASGPVGAYSAGMPVRVDQCRHRDRGHVSGVDERFCSARCGHGDHALAKIRGRSDLAA